MRITRKWKNILSIGLAVLVLFGAVGAVAMLVKNDSKTISPLVFSVGSIGSDGNYIKSEKSIYTKDLIECQGLSIEPDFECTGAFQVFFYGENKDFIGSTKIFNCEDGVYNRESSFPLAKYCRIVITPDVPEGKDADEFKIHFYEVLSYADDYTVTVDKKQNFSFSKVLKNFENVCVVLGQGVWDPTERDFTNGIAPFYFFDAVDVSGSNQMILKVKTSSLHEPVKYSDKEFSVPQIYDLIAKDVISIDYEVICVENEFSYISYDVSDYSSVFGFVDLDSIDILEIYVLNI